MSDETTKTTESEDVAMVLGQSEETGQVAILRKRDERIEAAVLSKVEEGVPLQGDLVRLKAREQSPLFDVETLYEAPSKPARRMTSAGPAQVATDRYREGWDRLFRKRRKPKRKPN